MLMAPQGRAHLQHLQHRQDPQPSAEVMVDAHSGTAGIAYWMNTHMGIDIDKRNPVVSAIRIASTCSMKPAARR
jgi:hypothetical protein